MRGDCAGIYEAVFVVSPYSTGSPAAAFINGKHDRTWPLEDTLTRVAAVASTGAGVKQIIQPSSDRKRNRFFSSRSDQECNVLRSPAVISLNGPLKLVTPRYQNAYHWETRPARPGTSRVS